MRRWLPAALIGGAVLFSLAVYSQLPEEVPVHWGFSGEPNRFGSRFEGAFLIPAMMIAFFAIMQWYPSRDPRAANIAKFRGAYDTVVTAIIALLSGLHVLSLDNVWMRSHRVGGYAMVVAGIITIVAGFVAQPVGYIVALASL